MSKIDPIVAQVRNLSLEFGGCRIEISSDERLPVSASSQDRTRYGFGLTVREAVHMLRTAPRAVQTTKEMIDQKK